MNQIINTQRPNTLFPEWTHCRICDIPVEKHAIGKQRMCHWCEEHWDEEAQTTYVHESLDMIDHSIKADYKRMEERERKEWDAAWFKELQHLKAEANCDGRELAMRIKEKYQLWKRAWLEERVFLHMDESQILEAVMRQEQKEKYWEEELRQEEEMRERFEKWGTEDTEGAAYWEEKGYEAELRQEKDIEEQERQQAEQEEPDESYFLNPPKSKNSTFELNLAEFPIAILNKTTTMIKKHEYSDTIIGRDGKKVERKWTIEAEAKDENGNALGFGGPITLEVIYELIQMWREQGFRNNKIYIGTYRQFLTRLGWGTGKTDYTRLKQALKCINGLKITGTNCFYIKAENGYKSLDGIGLFPGIGSLSPSEQRDHPDARYYIWVSPELLESVTKNNLFYFDIDRSYFKKLTPMEQKLGLILSKYFSVYKKSKDKWARSIHDLAQQIPIFCQSTTGIRRQLKRICDGLLAKEFKYLSNYKIDKDTITFYNKTAQLELPLENGTTATKPIPEYIKTDSLINFMKSEISDDPKYFPFYIKVAKYFPEDLIYYYVSLAKSEGHNKAKWFTTVITHEAESNGYFKPHRKDVNRKEKPVEQPDLFSQTELKQDKRKITAAEYKRNVDRYAEQAWDKLSSEEKQKYMEMATEEVSKIKNHSANMSIENYARFFFTSNLEKTDLEYKRILSNRP